MILYLPAGWRSDLGSHLFALNLVLLGFSGDKVAAWQVKMSPLVQGAAL